MEHEKKRWAASTITKLNAKLVLRYRVTARKQIGTHQVKNKQQNLKEQNDSKLECEKCKCMSQCANPCFQILVVLEDSSPAFHVSAAYEKLSYHY